MKSAILFFTLLNPFLLSVYLLSLIKKLDLRTFSAVLIRAGCISGLVFSLFALMGESVFDSVLQVRYASFLIFGGIIFLITGIRFTFGGVNAMFEWRGEPAHMAGSVAMPFMIGPATVSAGILMGEQMDILPAVGSIFLVLGITISFVILFKWIHDLINRHNEQLFERYFEILGRIVTLYVGAVSIDMILRGLEIWIRHARI